MNMQPTTTRISFQTTMLPHLSETDNREPLFTFSAPLLLGEGSYGLYWISISFWLELLSLVVLEMSLAALTSWVIYTTIIQPKRFDTTFSFVLGFGILLPIWIACPVFMVWVFDIRNLIFKFMIGVVVPIVSIFRTTEAMYGFCPAMDIQSARDYMWYFSSVMIFTRDKKGNYIKISFRETLHHLAYFLLNLVLTGLLQSILDPHPYFTLFGAPPANREEWYAPSRFLTWQLYANNAFHAVLFQIYLTTYCEGIIFFWSLLFGYRTDPVMKNPLFESTSPSDFWGRRWNLVIHRVLKGGVYKPVRKYFSASVAGVAAFLASGAFHEWLLRTLFTPLAHQLQDGNNCRDCFNPIYGSAMVFFIWQAIIIAGERMVGRSRPIQFLVEHLPLPIRTAMVIGLGLPLSHYFVEPYIRSQFFQHAQIGLPMIVRVN